jgi:uncharacterized protein (DUF1501 family)
MIRNLHRRDLLVLGAAASATSLMTPTAWAVTGATTKRLVVVMLRGAVDGLNVVVPYGEAAYYSARPSIAVPPPGREGGVLDLDGRFGLHPALAALKPLWEERSLAFVHASGSPDATRSHFDAQDYMESGTPGRKTTADGWMNRLLGVLPGTEGATSALSFGPTLPRIMAGPHSVANVPLGRSAASEIPLDRPVINAAFDRLYAGSDALSRAYQEGIAAHRKVMSDLQSEMMEADNGAPSPAGFAQDAAHLAQLVKRTPTIELAFFALGGWDTHVNQGAAEGQLAQRLNPLAEGLAGLVSGLGAAYRDTVIVVMSEFGRTVHENGNRGTDHGHGNVMWVLGGPVKGGQVYGAWPGLEREDLYEGRDLPVTTDFRSVLGGILTTHMQLDAAQVAAVLPDAPTHLPVLIGA